MAVQTTRGGSEWALIGTAGRLEQDCWRVNEGGKEEKAAGL